VVNCHDPQRTRRHLQQHHLFLKEKKRKERNKKKEERIVVYGHYAQRTLISASNIACFFLFLKGKKGKKE
jgi:hypothetical protein